jgi:WD40 repeat protein
MGHTGWISNLAFSADGAMAVSASWDASLRIWEVPGGRNVAVLQGHGGPVLAATFSTDGRYVVSGSIDDTVRVWSTATGAEINRLMLDKSASAARCLAFAPNEHWIFAGTKSGAIMRLEFGAHMNAHHQRGRR